MKKSFQIEGMTCAGCVAKVSHLIHSIRDVESVSIELETKKVELQASRPVQLSEIQSILAEHPKYAAKEMDQAERKPNPLKTYWPLLLIGAFLVLLSSIATLQSGEGLNKWMEYFMGGFFIVFSFFKFLDIRGFANSYRSYDLLARILPIYGFVYPFFELGLGLAWLFLGGTFEVALITVILMGFSAIGVIQAVSQKKSIQCACLGTVFNLPMSSVTIIEDLLMVLMASIMLLPSF
ncbi:MAG: heavy-metal-associated domain-containing protein [Flavobacteriales bacterium]